MATPIKPWTDPNAVCHQCACLKPSEVKGFICISTWKNPELTCFESKLDRRKGQGEA